MCQWRHLIFPFAPWVHHSHNFITWLSPNRLKLIHRTGIRLSAPQAQELGHVGAKKKSIGISESPLLEGHGDIIMVFVDRAGCVASVILSPKVCGLKLNRLQWKLILLILYEVWCPSLANEGELLSFGWHAAHRYCLELPSFPCCSPLPSWAHHHGKRKNNKQILKPCSFHFHIFLIYPLLSFLVDERCLSFRPFEKFSISGRPTALARNPASAFSSPADLLSLQLPASDSRFLCEKDGIFEALNTTAQAWSFVGWKREDVRWSLLTGDIPTNINRFDLYSKVDTLRMEIYGNIIYKAQWDFLCFSITSHTP